MRKTQKRQAEDFLKLLEQAHDQIRKDIETGKNEAAMGLLAQCQEGVVELGNMIEQEEGEQCTVIPLLQSYCELVYEIYQDLQKDLNINEKRIHKNLRKSLIQIENRVKNDIKTVLEVVFLPYKASMWDSMESIWMTADNDQECNAYVVPIPYYERNKDGSFGVYHYEGNDFPDYVPVIHYEKYNLPYRKPDVIYIHNPYDQNNYVTSVDPRYYSGELKKYTDCLVYVPYYVTAGGMSEAQSLCPSYFNMDYIVVQSEEIISFFDSRIPREKFLPFGSPKFDKVIRLCQNPPEPPEKWKDRIEGRKVYFYNTSIGGMLDDTETFLKKVEYVFQCFQKRKDACLLWRPHPLLETTFETMRSNFYPRYRELKQYFIDNGLGIYDNTPDITKTIALCDAYVGDAGTSVTSLFGIAGKPMFILNNNFYSEPEQDDWRGQIIGGFNILGNDKWLITQGNKLYYSPNNDYKYEYYCNLSEYSGGSYYLRVIEIGENIYVCPRNAQDILVIKDRKIDRKIPLKRHLEKWGAFIGAWNIGKYLFLIPDQYPAIVRYDTVQEKVEYISGYQEIFTGYIEGEKKIGGSCIWGKYLLIASPINSRILAINSDTKEIQILDTGAENGGYLGMISDGTDIWMSPFSGTTLTRWNPDTGKLYEYSDVPKDFVCKSQPYGYECLKYPYGVAAFYENLVFLSPGWGNMFLCLNKDTGEMTEWKTPFEVSEVRKNGYYISGSKGYFLYQTDSLKEGNYRFFSPTDCRLYDVSLKTGEYQEIKVEFNLEELKEQEAGFAEISEWLPYSCQESCFNSLMRFLDGDIEGNPFEKVRQLQAYRRIAANHDGTSGEKIHRFFRERK